MTKTETNGDGAPSAASVGGQREASPTAENGKARRSQRNYPAATFEDSLLLAETIQKFASGTQTRRITLFDHLDKSPESGPSRQLVTNSSKYGLTTGSYKAEYLELTTDGATATDSEAAPRERLRAQFRHAIESVEPFKQLYEAFSDKKLPAQAVMRDFLRGLGMDDSDAAEAVDIFVGNAKFIGLLKTLSGAERLVTLEHLLDELPGTAIAGRVSESFLDPPNGQTRQLGYLLRPDPAFVGIVLVGVHLVGASARLHVS